MMKVITGYLRVDSEESMEEISGILNRSNCIVEDESVDYIYVSDLDPDALDTLFKDGWITEEEYRESAEVDTLKFYLD